jgi:hypothetical protein
MGAKAVDDVRRAQGNGGACVRAPACTQKPRGTGRGAGMRHLLSEHSAHSTPSSDQQSLHCLGVRASMYGGGHSGHSVNRNRSVRFFGYSVNSVTSEPRTDRFLRELGTEAFRFRVIRFGFGSNRKEPKFSKHKSSTFKCKF